MLHDFIVYQGGTDNVFSVDLGNSQILNIRTVSR